MGKRVNPYRRLLASQAATLAAARKEQSVLNGMDMSKLQQGHVRSHFASVKSKAIVRRTKDGQLVETMREPNWSSEDVPGKVKRKRPNRFAKT